MLILILIDKQFEVYNFLGMINDYHSYLIFIFRIQAKNIPRIVNGETYYEDGQMNALIQQIVIPDLPSNSIVEVEFTEQEFDTWRTFCRNVTRFIDSKQFNQLTGYKKLTVKWRKITIIMIFFQFQLLLEFLGKYTTSIQMH